jgi:hypothetical protein
MPKHNSKKKIRGGNNRKAKTQHHHKQQKKHARKSHRQKKHITVKNNGNKKLLPIVYGKMHMTRCGHCVNLIPEWDIVNEKMKMYPEVVCYDIERDEEGHKLPKFNESYKPYENLQIQGGYPTIYKLHKRGGAIIYYNGQRDNASMLKWLMGSHH